MASVGSLTPLEFVQRWPEWRSGEEVVLLDVREPHEIDIASVEGGQRIPMGQIPSRWGELHKDRTVVVMCHGGMRSMRVAEFLFQHGFASVFNLTGGIDAWSMQVDSKVPRY